MICKKCKSKPTARGLRDITCILCNKKAMVNVAFRHICNECSDKKIVCQYCGDKTIEGKNTKDIFNFRSDLIMLLNKYNYSISGCSEAIIIEDNTNNNCYTIANEDNSNYTILDENNNNILSNYILDKFPENTGIYQYYNGKIGIFTNSRHKCVQLLDILFAKNKDNVKVFRKSEKTLELILHDDTIYEWIIPDQDAIGYGCSKAYIDKNVTIDELHDVILPICILCSRDNVTII